jgi:2-aminoadipate transaminase
MKSFLKKGFFGLVFLVLVFSSVSFDLSIKEFSYRRVKEQNSSFIQRIKNSLLSIYANKKKGRIALQYGLSLGNMTLRKQVATFVKNLGIEVSPEANIGIFDGEVEIFDILSLMFMRQSEGYVFYQKDSDIKPLLPCKNYYSAALTEFDSSDLGSLEEKIQEANALGKAPRFIYLNGNGLTKEQGEEIYNLAKKYNLLIIENITNSTPEDYLLTKIDKDGRVIAIGNFNKYLGEANKLGFAVAGEGIMRLMEIAKGGLTLHPNALLQSLVSEILSEEGVEGEETSVNGKVEKFDFKQLLSEAGLRLKPSAIREILKYSKYPEIIYLAGGIPDGRLFPLNKIAQIIENFTDEEWKEIESPQSFYEGSLRLRKALSVWLSKRGISVNEAQILPTNGSQQALDLIGRGVGKDGVIITETPTYIGALTAFQPHGCDVRARDLRTEEGLENLEKEIEQMREKGEKPPVIYVTPTFGNPSGYLWTFKERENLISLVHKFWQEGYKIRIVEDDPYGELNYTGEKITKMKELDQDGSVIYLTSNSKVSSPGVRIGYIIGDENIVRDFKKMMENEGSYVPMLPQLIIAKFIERGELDYHIQNVLIPTYSKRAQAMQKALENYMPDGVTWTEPKGGMFVWVGVPEEWDINMKELFKKAADEGIKVDGKIVKAAFVPGVDFSVDGSTSNFMRLNFVSKDEDEIKLGVRVIAKLIEAELIKKGSPH